MASEQSERPDVQWWYVRRAVAAALRLANNDALDDLRAELGAYQHNRDLVPGQQFPQSEDMRDALAHLLDRCREMGIDGQMALDKVEEQLGPRPDPDRMILPPPGYDA